MLEHPWNVTPKEAIALQKRLSRVVERSDRLAQVRHVAGIDIGFAEDNKVTVAAVVVLGFPELDVRDQAVARRPTTFPYVPGLLSFREAPAALEALARLEIRPDLLLCDGQGVAHPRRMGLACHLGLLADIPAIGVAKSRLVGRHEPLPVERGAWRPLRDGNEIVGAALRTRTGVRPVYVSVGHRISLETALDYVMRCTPKFRLPETTRQAHRLASRQEKR